MDEKKKENKIISDFDCPICFLIIAEPIKLNCAHIICLGCFEKLLINNSRKCPLCRKEFDDKSVDFDSQFFRKNYNLNSEEILERFEKIYHERLSKKGHIELSIAYGNEHVFVSSENMNKHEWKAFVRLEKSNGTLKSFLDKFKQNAHAKLYFEHHQNPDNDKLKNLLNLMQQKDEKEKEFNNINVNELDIIKRVTFFLHPTFNPHTVYIEEKPFELQRLGWGTFNIPISIEFKDNLNMDTLNVDFDLCFSRPIMKKQHPIWLNASLD